MRLNKEKINRFPFTRADISSHIFWGWKTNECFLVVLSINNAAWSCCKKCFLFPEYSILYERQESNIVVQITAFRRGPVTLSLPTPYYIVDLENGSQYRLALFIGPGQCLVNFSIWNLYSRIMNIGIVFLFICQVIEQYCVHTFCFRYNPSGFR